MYFMSRAGHLRLVDERRPFKQKNGRVKKLGNENIPNLFSGGQRNFTQRSQRIIFEVTAVNPFLPTGPFLAPKLMILFFLLMYFLYLKSLL